MIKLSPSILSADFSNLGRDIKMLDKHGADMIHIDVMDGIFVPNISFGIPVIKAIKPLTQLPFDVHLMIEQPSRYIDDFIGAGADIITVHYETDKHIDRTVNYIKQKGAKAGIALNPATPVEVLENILPSLDMVLIMTVNPGFGGQRFIQYSFNKIKKIYNMINSIKKDIMIEVDGGVTKDNIDLIINAGANVIVAGSAVFKDNNIKDNILDIKKGF